MFKTRLLSGILLVVIALVTVITGGNVLFATLFLISMIGVYELYRVFAVSYTHLWKMHTCQKDMTISVFLPAKSTQRW